MSKAIILIFPYLYCLQFERVAVRLGEYDLSHEIDCSDEDDPDSCAPPYQDIAVAKYSINDNYDDRVISSSDIGIVKLMTPFQANSKYCGCTTMSIYHGLLRILFLKNS